MTLWAQDRLSDTGSMRGTWRNLIIVVVAACLVAPLASADEEGAAPATETPSASEDTEGSVDDSPHTDAVTTADPYDRSAAEKGASVEAGSPEGPGSPRVAVEAQGTTGTVTVAGDPHGHLPVGHEALRTAAVAAGSLARVIVVAPETGPGVATDGSNTSLAWTADRSDEDASGGPGRSTEAEEAEDDRQVRPSSLLRHVADLHRPIPVSLGLPDLPPPPTVPSDAEARPASVAAAPPPAPASGPGAPDLVGGPDGAALLALSGAVAIAALALTATVPGTSTAAQSAPWLARWLTALRRGVGIGLYARLAKDRVLDHGTRNDLVAFLRDRPGACLVEMKAAVGASLNTIRHHLEVLRANGLVVDVREGRRRCFFLVGDGRSAATREVLAALSAAPVRRVFTVIQERPGIRQQELAAALGVTPTSVIFHARRLEAVGVVRRQRDGREVAYFPQVPSAVA